MTPTAKPTRGGRRYGDGPCIGELVAVLIAGAAHVLTEIFFSESLAFGLSAAVSVAFLVYLIWRASRTPGILRAWGMRVDNLLPALRIHLVFVVVGGASLLGFGALSGSLEFPIGFWLTLALYPIWGVAQQFALQSLIARNLSSLFTRAWTLAVAAAVLFALSHYPRIDLVGLTLVAGLGFTVIYQRLPNLWAVGTAHGVLGTIAAYAVLGEDPGGAILGWLTRI